MGWRLRACQVNKRSSGFVFGSKGGACNADPSEVTVEPKNSVQSTEPAIPVVPEALAVAAVPAAPTVRTSSGNCGRFRGAARSIRVFGANNSVALVYLLGGVAFAGGLGTWLPLLQYAISSKPTVVERDAIKLSGHAYVVSILVTIIFDSVLSLMQGDRKSVSGFGVVASTILAIVVLAVGLLDFPSPQVFNVYISVFAPASLAYVIWWIVCFRDPRFQSKEFLQDWLESPQLGGDERSFPFRKKV